MPLAAQNELLLSEGLDGFHHSLVLADNPDTGDVLAVWAMRAAPSFDRVSIMARLLKRSNSGDYKPQKVVEVASGSGSRAATLENARPDVMWAPGMKSYYAVWINGQDGSANEVRGRRLKRQNGKPKGGFLTLGAGNTFHDSPTIGAQLVNGKHDARIFYSRRAPGTGNEHAFELAGHDLSKSGKPSGEALVELTVTQQSLFIGDVFAAPDSTEAIRGVNALRDCHIKKESEASEDGKQKCFLVLYKSGKQVDSHPVDCDDEFREIRRGARSTWRLTQDGRVNRVLITGPCSLLRITDVDDRSSQGRRRLVSASSLSPLPGTGLEIVGAPETESTQRGADDLYAVSRDDSVIWLTRISSTGTLSSNEVIEIAPEIVDLRGTEVPTNGSRGATRQAMVVWIDGGFGSNNVRARLIDLE